MTGWTWAASRRASLSVLMAGLCAATPALAQTAADAPLVCRAGATPAEANACAQQAFVAADATIAVLYADVRRALSAHERPQLGQEQSAWLRARAAQCPASAHPADALRYACLERVTQLRRQGLMRWLSADSPATQP